MRSSAAKFRGFAVVSAIFILVVLATLGAFIVNISTSQQIGSALDVQGVRAYQAARAGIEWGLYRQLAAVPASCAGATSFSPAAATLSSFTVTVVCTDTTDGRSTPPIHTYVIQSTACSVPNVAEPKCPNTTNPGSLYIERRIEVAF